LPYYDETYAAEITGPVASLEDLEAWFLGIAFSRAFFQATSLHFWHWMGHLGASLVSGS
jgi:hypothetical protein